MKQRPTIILSATQATQHPAGGPAAYPQYVRHLERASRALMAEKDGGIDELTRGYWDWLQAPLQPLMDDLQSSTYEVFERDPVKYRNYEEATFQALNDRPEHQTLYVVRKLFSLLPLVPIPFPLPSSLIPGTRDRAPQPYKPKLTPQRHPPPNLRSTNPGSFIFVELAGARSLPASCAHSSVRIAKRASMRSRRTLALLSRTSTRDRDLPACQAWERGGSSHEYSPLSALLTSPMTFFFLHPAAISALQRLQERQALEWGGSVEIIFGDMRTLDVPEPADIIVSELLGSFGDNELSPECLDGAMRFLKRAS